MATLNSLLTGQRLGIQCMRVRKYQDACGYLQKSLEELREFVQAQTDDGAILSSSSRNIAIRSVELIHEKYTQEPYSFLGYFKAFEVSPLTETLSLEIAMKFSVVFLYNLALCHQLTGLASISSQKNFTMAARLYKMANQIIDERKSMCVWFGWVHLALLNNMGSICSLLSKPDSLKQCAKVMENMLAYGTPLPEDDFTHFHLNIIVLNQTGGVWMAPMA